MPLTVKEPVTSRSPKMRVLICVKESLPAPFTRRLEDNPGMLKLISLVVNDPHVTALTVVKDDAVAAPPTVADDALSGPQAMSPCSVVFV